MKFLDEVKRLVGGPATLLVLGSIGSGKTSLINAMLRCASSEACSSMCPSAPKDTYKVCHAYYSTMFKACSDAGEVLDNVTLRAIDSPPVTFDDVGLARLTRVLERGVYDMMDVDGADEPGWDRVACDCVVIVVNFRDCDMDDLKKLADVVHEFKVPFVVAVTHKDRADRADDFIEEVAETCEVHDSEVFFLKNCVKRSSMDRETEEEMEALLRQAALYIIRRRMNMILYHKEKVPKECDDTEEESDDDLGFSLFD